MLPPCRQRGGECCSSLLTLALDGVEWSVLRPGCTLPLGKEPVEAGWASELVWTQRLEEKSFAFAGD
jgi:hypothetical protein